MKGSRLPNSTYDTHPKRKNGRPSLLKQARYNGVEECNSDAIGLLKTLLYILGGSVSLESSASDSEHIHRQSRHHADEVRTDSCRNLQYFVNHRHATGS